MASLEKQHLILTQLMSSPDLASLTAGILKPEFFDSRYRSAASFIMDYIAAHKALPTPEILKVETGVAVSPKPLLKSEFDYSAGEIETFCRHAAIEKLIVYGANLLSDEKEPASKKKFGELEEMIKNAMSMGLHKDLGISYFKNPRERLQKMLENNIPIPTGWPSIDDLIGGGLNKKELLLFAANSGVGKSIFMANISVNLLELGFNVLYISLELSDVLVSKRFDAMITQVPYSDIMSNINEVANLVTLKGQNMGELTIKRMKESVTTVNDIRSYLKEFELVNGYLPEVIVVDYVDLLASNKNVSSENMFLKDKFVAEELRGMMDEFDAIGVSAVQLGRGALEKKTEEQHQGNIQGGMSKVNTTDNLLAIFQNDLQKAAGEFLIKALKTRNSGGAGKECQLAWNAKILRVTEVTGLNLKAKQNATMPEVNLNTGTSKAKDVMGILSRFNAE